MASRSRRGPVGPDHQPRAAAREMLVGNFFGELAVIDLVIVPADALLGHAGGAAGFENVERAALVFLRHPDFGLQIAQPFVLEMRELAECRRKHFTSVAGFQPAFLAQSSQNGEPVSGEKCHCMISRTCASSFSWAALMVAESGFISDFIGQALAAGVGNRITCGGFGSRKIFVDRRSARRTGEQRENNHAQRRAKHHRHDGHVTAGGIGAGIPEPDIAGGRRA